MDDLDGLDRRVGSEGGGLSFNESFGDDCFNSVNLPFGLTGVVEVECNGGISAVLILGSRGRLSKVSSAPDFRIANKWISES